MKVLVSFTPSAVNNHFEGARLRKTIKGSLEMANVEYTTNVLDMYDVIHLMSPEDEDKIRYANDLRIPVIISALYCEDDPVASYIEYKSIDGKRITSLSNKALRFLNKGDLVLVPSVECKDFLIKQGVNTRIEISVPGINLARFNFSRDDEKEIFYRYFRQDKSKRIVLAIGDYESMDGLNAFINAAKKCPETSFYYIGRNNGIIKPTHKIKHLIKKCPENVRFDDVLPNDVYRSLLLNADIVFFPGYKPAGVITVLEAMASKCQIIARKQTIFSDIIKDGENAHIAEFSETLSSLVRDYLENKIKPTIEEAYNYVSTYSLTEYGKQLESIYIKEIKIKKGVKDYD